MFSQMLLPLVEQGLTIRVKLFLRAGGRLRRPRAVGLLVKAPRVRRRRLEAHRRLATDHKVFVVFEGQRDVDRHRPFEICLFVA